MNKTVLVVDDEPKIVKLAQDYLERAGFRVIAAGDGSTAVSLFRHERPDLVVLDLNLPGAPAGLREAGLTDGLDVCRALRRVSDVPIIMLTARADEADRLVGLELGADDYVVKPFSPRELVARVRGFCAAPRGTYIAPGSSGPGISRSTLRVTASPAAANRCT